MSLEPETDTSRLLRMSVSARSIVTMKSTLGSLEKAHRFRDLSEAQKGRMHHFNIAPTQRNIAP